MFCSIVAPIMQSHILIIAFRLYQTIKLCHNCNTKLNVVYLISLSVRLRNLIKNHDHNAPNPSN